MTFSHAVTATKKSLGFSPCDGLNPSAFAAAKLRLSAHQQLAPQPSKWKASYKDALPVTPQLRQSTTATGPC
ncbi:MAG: hypothetical protein ACRD3S_10495, partial [Terracidiphilus sp.]